jgi:hypothetical protein
MLSRGAIVVAAKSLLADRLPLPKLKPGRGVE